jgi:hypothetical protein
VAAGSYPGCFPPGFYNSSLYDLGSPTGASYPSTGVINPPGTYKGFGPPMDPSWYQWLDGVEWFESQAPTFVRFNDWENLPSPPWPLVGFDEWCRGADFATPNPHNRHDLPVSAPPNGEEIAIRFSLEWNTTGAFSHDKNIQSFLVLIKRDQP